MFNLLHCYQHYKIDAHFFINSFDLALQYYND